MSVQPYGNGHINDTYLAFYRGSRLIKIIHQRINHNVFQQPEQLMENIQKVTSHLYGKLQSAGVTDIHRRVLSLIPTHAGKIYFLDDNGNFWRTYTFIDDARSFDTIQSHEHAYEVGFAFGEYLHLLQDLPASDLHETIPAFHHTRSRLDDLIAAVQQDTHNRASGVKKEISFALNREFIADHLIQAQTNGLLPTRVIHNDTKVNNLLMDQTTQKALCVTDLDTTMPGLSLFDFGDMIRTGAASCTEDELDLTKAHIQLPIFSALVHGYLDGTHHCLLPVELNEFVFSAKLITFEIGIRFLTDYLFGDSYFKIDRPDHNLDRARVQFKLVESIENQYSQMMFIVEEAQSNLDNKIVRA